MVLLPYFLSPKDLCFKGILNFEGMKPMTCILIVVFSFLFMGTSFTFFGLLADIRCDMEEEITEDKGLQCLTFSEADFRNLKWEERYQEFRWAGRMYDVASIETRGDRVLVHCIFDSRETDLRNTLSELFQDKPGKHSPLRLWVQLLAQPLYPSSGFVIPDVYREVTVLKDPYGFNLHTFEYPLGDPPPRG